MTQTGDLSPMDLLNQRLEALGTSDLNEFRQLMRRMRKIFPEQAAEAFLWYIASHGLNEASRSMSIWLSGDSVYISALLDSDSLPVDVAIKSIQVVKQLDPDFLFKFTKAAVGLESSHRVLRTLSLLPAIGDYSLLIPWLRGLADHGDLKVRSRAAKLLCELRPNKGLIQRQMQSSDPRVRASAIEALWHSRSEDARELFQMARHDTHHRVVSNALVGLYKHGESGALNEIVELCGHKDQLFRAAMAWALGLLEDVKAIPVLQELTRDKSNLVRKRALSSLLALESLKPAQEEATPVPSPDALPGGMPAIAVSVEVMPMPNLFVF